MEFESTYGNTKHIFADRWMQEKIEFNQFLGIKKLSANYPVKSTTASDSKENLGLLIENEYRKFRSLFSEKFNFHLKIEAVKKNTW